MIDIVSTIEAKFEKYKSVLNFFDKKDHYDLIIILDNTINYIKNKYDNRSVEEKTSAVYVVKEFWKKNKSFKINDIKKIIDEFLEYRKGLINFIDSLVIMQSRFDAEVTYYDSFITKKLKNLTNLNNEK